MLSLTHVTDRHYSLQGCQTIFAARDSHGGDILEWQQLGPSDYIAYMKDVLATQLV
jgi:hypothetical protein